MREHMERVRDQLASPITTTRDEMALIRDAKKRRDDEDGGTYVRRVPRKPRGTGGAAVAVERVLEGV